METFAVLLDGADKEFAAGEVPPQSAEWVSKVDEAVENGVISKEERESLNSFRGFLREAADQSKVAREVTSDEKRLLKKWKSSSN